MEYIQTWEIHRSGYPHVNVIVSNAELYRQTCDDRFGIKKRDFDPMCQEVGFGFCRWLEPIRSNDRMAGYLTKLGLELTGTGKIDQTPINAPRHFRRIRASRGLLPKRKKDDKITGALYRLPNEQLNAYLNWQEGQPCPGNQKPSQS